MAISNPNSEPSPGTNAPGAATAAAGRAAAELTVDSAFAGFNTGTFETRSSSAGPALQALSEG